MFPNNEYIHPDSHEIKRFINSLHVEHNKLDSVVEALFQWFDKNIAYSRLNAPYDPPQRSDLDVLKMRCGTCGDYTNLIVSVLSGLGYQTKYAVVQTDRYGDPQDHICAAVWDAGRWRLIDATLPYRKWHGMDCPHKEYVLLSCDDMKKSWRQEERYWTAYAAEWKKPSFAGLLYAPWIHEEIVRNTEDSLETVFFLLLMDSAHEYHINVYDLVYSENDASASILCRVTEDETVWRFSENRADNLWDEKQWGTAYAKENIPERLHSDRFSRMEEATNRIVPLIQKAVPS